MPSTRRLVTAVALACSVAVTAAGCSVPSLMPPEKSYEFARWGDAPKTGTRSFVLDGWMPSDATDIRVDTLRHDHEEAVLTLRTATSPADMAGCAPADPVPTTPSLAPEWLPDDLPTAGYACGDWTVVADGDQVWAWRHAS